MQKRHSFYWQTGRYLWLSTTVNILACTFMPLTRFSYAEFRFTLNPNRYKIRCAAQSEILQGGFEDEEIINYRTNLSVAHLE